MVASLLLCAQKQTSNRIFAMISSFSPKSMGDKRHVLKIDGCQAPVAPVLTAPLTYKSIVKNGSKIVKVISVWPRKCLWMQCCFNFTASYLLNYLFTSLQLLHTLCAQYYKMKQVDATDFCQTPSAITFSVNHFNLWSWYNGSIGMGSMGSLEPINFWRVDSGSHQFLEDLTKIYTIFQFKSSKK